MTDMEPIEPRPRRVTRIGNPERQQILQLLQTAVDDGYLTLEEFDERQQLVMASRTAEEAEGTVQDLPQFHAIQDQLESERDESVPLWMIAVWITWGAAIGVNLAVWLLVLLTTGSTAAYWPVWVFASSGIAVGSLALLEKLVVRPAVADYRRKKRREDRPRFSDDEGDSR